MKRYRSDHACFVSNLEISGTTKQVVVAVGGWSHNFDAIESEYFEQSTQNWNIIGTEHTSGPSWFTRSAGVVTSGSNSILLGGVNCTKTGLLSYPECDKTTKSQQFDVTTGEWIEKPDSDKLKYERSSFAYVTAPTSLFPQCS